MACSCLWDVIPGVPVLRWILRQNLRFVLISITFLCLGIVILVVFGLLLHGRISNKLVSLFAFTELKLVRRRAVDREILISLNVSGYDRIHVSQLLEFLGPFGSSFLAVDLYGEAALLAKASLIHANSLSAHLSAPLMSAGPASNGNRGK